MITLAHGFIYINRDIDKIPYDTLRYYKKDLKKSKLIALKRYYEKLGCVY
tara:strand:+ start:116 stop:265 length:150 start_codon:yes stop_codon:yes gene_type:complete